VIPILVFPLAGFVVAAILLLQKTTFGRAVYAVGNSQTVARLSGVNVRATIVAVYAISALCAGLGGWMLLGFANQSFIGMGDQFLLPSIAAVVIGGASALGGRGKYIGTVGGALLLEALSAVLGAVFQSAATQDILYGVIILLAMVAVRS
jgi:ribose transport system permease protein